MAISKVIDVKIILFFIALLVYFGYEAYKAKNRFSNKKLILWVCVRSLLIISLFMVVIGVKFKFKPKDTSTIFLVDSSLSTVEYKNEVEDYINSQLEDKSKKDRVSVIVFGKEPMIEQPFSDDVSKVSLNTKINDNFTNIEKAVEFALNYFPKDSNKRLVLITDGKENDGNVINQYKRVADENVNLLVKKIELKKRRDVQLTSIEVPDKVHKGENIPVKVAIDSTEDDIGDFYLFNEGKKIIDKKISVKKGTQHFDFSVPSSNKNKFDFTGEIKFNKDFVKLNNKVEVSTAVESQANVLIIGDNNDTKAINSLMDSLNIKHSNYKPSEVPTKLDFISKFEEVFMVNVSHDSMPKGLEENLDKSVKELGKGLIVIGGENTFALGNYENTKLEKMLPVNCKMKGDKKQPNLGLVLLIDCSGSMEDKASGIKKIELAKEAAVQSIKAIEQGDYLGILAFSDTLEWVVPFGQVKDKQKLIDGVGKLSSKGGTLIMPGINEAVSVLDKANAKVKHMILLTDGQGEKDGFEKYVNKMKSGKITMSTVAVGSDADKTVLDYLASSTGGRKYFTEDFKTVPKIFTKETYLSSKKYINNLEVNPVQVREEEYFAKTELPSLKGYIGTSMKDEGNLILKSKDDSPILATWQYGLGKVAVWTSDLNGKWSANWTNWNGFQNKWSGIINWCLGGYDENKINMELSQDGSEVNVIIGDGLSKLDKNSKVYEGSIIVNGPDDYKKEIMLNSISNGKYMAKFGLENTGDYLVTAILKEKGKVILNKTKSIQFNYSAEYNINSNKNIIDSFVNSVSGKYISDENVFSEKVVKAYAYVPLEVFLVPFALILFLIDIVIRMTNWIV